MRKIFTIIILFSILPNIVFAMHKENKYFSEQYYFGVINMSQYVSWQISEGEGVVVAIIDEGVWLQHPDLIDANWTNNDEIPNNKKDDDNNGYIDDYYGWNFVDNNNDLVSKGNHGTAVAGIIAARDNTIGIVGIAPKSKIMPLTVCDSKGCYDDAIYNAIMYAADNGADVINLSLGATNGYVGYNTDFNTAISHAYNKGVVIVAAAGNGDTESAGQTGMNLDFYKVSPVNNNLVLGVGALDKSGKYRTNWSNYGDGVDIYAPGEEIISTVVPMYSSNYGYDSLDGTSFSAPMVAGAIALLKSYYILSNSEIIDQIVTKSNKGTLDIRSSLEGIDITKRRDYASSLPEETPKADEPQEVNNQNITEESNSSEEANEEAIKTFIKEEKEKINTVDNKLSERLKGRILLQVENHGEAWYINPKNSKRYYMADGGEAYKIMRDLGIGINNKDLGKIWADKSFAKKYSGKIFLQVEANGEAYYIDFNGVAHYLKDGAIAYTIMRELGMGITNNDIRKIEIGE